MKRTMKKACALAAPLTLAALFATSCSDYDNGYDEVAVRYEQNFVERFGNIDPNQDWNLVGQLAKQGETRTAYPNGNMWASEGWIVPDPLTESQKELVRLYFQYNKEPKGEAIDYSNFFAQQVYTGGTKPATGNDLPSGYVDVNTLSKEKYLAADNNNYIDPGKHMDQLTAGSGHEHIYNFNSGTCSTYGNVQDNDCNGSHPDEIMLMTNSQTDCFGYWNSDASYGHDDRYVIISGETIEEWGRQHGIYCNPSISERWFVGFDFDMVPQKEIYTGSYLTYNGVQYPYISDNKNTYCGTFETMDEYSQVLSYLESGKDPAADGMERLVDRIARAKELLSQGYLPTQNNGFVKVGGCNDGYYSDWIVCITPGYKKDGSITYESTRTKEDGLLVCEDLGDYDFDFNDVVLKLEHKQTLEDGRVTANKLVITAMAAGGTLPSYIYFVEKSSNGQVFVKEHAVQGADGSNEIHALLNSEELTPINAGRKFGSEGQKWEYTLQDGEWDETKYANGFVSQIFTDQQILIRVGDPVDGKEITTLYHGEDANGYQNVNAPQMMLLPVEFEWAQELQWIEKGYQDFPLWVQNANYTDWWKNQTNKESYITERFASQSNTPVSTNLTVSSSSLSLTAGDVNTNITYSTNSPAPVSVTTSNSSVATVEKNGNAVKITAVGAGTATITVSQTATDGYTAASQTITVTVAEKSSGNNGGAEQGGDNTTNDYGKSLSNVGSTPDQETYFNLEELFSNVGNGENIVLTLITSGSNYTGYMYGYGSSNNYVAPENISFSYNDDRTQTTITAERSWFEKLKNNGYSQFSVKHNTSFVALYVRSF